MHTSSGWSWLIFQWISVWPTVLLTDTSFPIKPIWHHLRVSATPPWSAQTPIQLIPFSSILLIPSAKFIMTQHHTTSTFWRSDPLPPIGRFWIILSRSELIVLICTLSVHATNSISFWLETLEEKDTTLTGNLISPISDKLLTRQFHDRNYSSPNFYERRNFVFCMEYSVSMSII